MPKKVSRAKTALSRNRPKKVKINNEHTESDSDTKEDQQNGVALQGSHSDLSVASASTAGTEVTEASGVTTQNSTQSSSASSSNTLYWEKTASFEDMLKAEPGFKDSTKELECSGTIINYITDSDEQREIEKEWLNKLVALKNEAELGDKQFRLSVDRVLKYLYTSDLMEMSYQDVIKILQTITGTKVQTFEEMWKILLNLQGSDILKKLNSKSKNAMNEQDLFSVSDEEEDNYITSPTEKLKLVNVSTKGSKNDHSFVFPSPSVMVKSAKTPTASVFTFGSAVAPPSTNKAPRHLKPGEILYSQRGSPVMVPRIASAINKAESIKLNANDGKKLIELLVVPVGDEKDSKEFKEKVAGIRGYVATQSIKKDRIRPPRIPKGPPPSSASKRPNWY